MALRQVAVHKWHRDKGEIQYSKAHDCNGVFHQWGVCYEEFEAGPGNYSTAIVELPSGEVRNVPVELVVFVD